jgi:hypothetical protein
VIFLTDLLKNILMIKWKSISIEEVGEAEDKTCVAIVSDILKAILNMPTAAL